MKRCTAHGRMGLPAFPTSIMRLLTRGESGAGSLGGAQQLTGGGVVAEMFRDLQKPSRFSGGGVVAELFRDLQKPSRFSRFARAREILTTHSPISHDIH